MRLICPGCGAQYEVPDAVIPPEGRDVQCSDCNTTWYARPAPIAPPSPPEPAAIEKTDTEGVVPPPAETNAENAPQGPEDPPLARRQLDPDVLSVLREEAAFEARAKAAERERNTAAPPMTEAAEKAVETQPEPEEQPRRIAPRGGVAASTPAEPATSAPVPAPQVTPVANGVEEDDAGNALPDPKAITDTLTGPASTKTATVAMTDQPAPARGTRGFLLVVTIAALALLGYVFAEDLSEAIPGAAASLETYVVAVDELRAWLDAQVLHVMAWINGAETPAPDVGS